MSRPCGSFASFQLFLAVVCAPTMATVTGAAGSADTMDGECEIVELLQYGSPRHKGMAEILSPGSDQEPVALVDEVYTYGAPATHKEPFRNAARKDGCFPGMRSYTENLLGAMNEIHQVDAASMFNYYPHAWIDSVVLRWGMDSLYTPCTGPDHGHPDWPKRAGQVYQHWPIHHQDNYQGRLDHLSISGRDLSDEEPFKSARKFVLFAFKSYDSIANTKREIAERMPDWSLVQREVYKTAQDEDPVMVIQQGSTLDCAFVFTGTNSVAEYSTSTTQYGAEYCGFDGVHVGYRNELSTITNALWKKVRPTLEQCNRVICVGHSLGGSLCEVFAACANSGNTTDPDYQKLVWEKAKNPKRMPSIEG